MGAKHDLAPKVARIVAALPEGPCLDLFAGMCSVAGALASTARPAWCNDVQAYATAVARALVATPAPPDVTAITRSIEPFYEENRKELRARFEQDLEDERRVITRSYRRQYEAQVESWRHAGNDDKVAAEFGQLRDRPQMFPFRLATLAYAYGYFGLEQAIELDSIAYGIERAAAEAELSVANKDWALVGLLQTASRIASTTGHFAEYLHPHSASTFRRIRLMRRRGVYEQWQLELGRVSPYGTEAWRQSNRVHNGDAVETLSMIARTEAPAVVYADPPYSRAQYSRYYHVLETLVLYDYPEIAGAGRYRTGRFQTPFSHAASVEQAFGQLIDTVADAGASLVLSYPSNGLLYERGVSPAKLMRERFRVVWLAGHTAAAHSTMGGAAGAASLDVRELIFVGQKPG